MFLNLFVLSLSTFALEYPTTHKTPTIEYRMGYEIKDDYKWMENPSDLNLEPWLRAQNEVTKKSISQELIDTYANEIYELDNFKSSTVTKNLAFAPIDNLYFEKSFFETTEVGEYTYEYSSLYGGDLSRMMFFKKDTKEFVDVLLVKFAAVLKIDGENIYYVNYIDGELGGAYTALLKHKIGSNQGDDEVIFESHNPQISVDFSCDKALDDCLLSQTDYRDNSTVLRKFNLNSKVASGMVILESASVLNSESFGKGPVYILDYTQNEYGQLYSIDHISFKLQKIDVEIDFNLESFMEVGFRDYDFLIGNKDAESVIYKFSGNSLELFYKANQSSLYIKNLDYTKKTLEITEQSYARASVDKLYSFDNNAWEVKAQSGMPFEITQKKLSYQGPLGINAAIYLFYKKDTVINESTPLVVYGYGGFHVTLMPSYNSVNSLAWLKRGGAFAVVSLPGSLTYGPRWNEIAKVGDRTVAWDAFASATQTLHAQGISSSNHSAILGGSNGGLLVGGTLLRHPSLFKAAVPMVGVLDMLNYSSHTAGKYWEWEYGNPHSEEDLPSLFEISPVHNVKAVDYPSTLVMTAEFDDRVEPFHSYKFAAKLQELNTSNNPILLYTKDWAGHSSRSGSRSLKYSYLGVLYAFLENQLK